MKTEQLTQKLIARMVLLGYICTSHQASIERIKEYWFYRDQQALIDLISEYEKEMRLLVRFDFHHCCN